MKEVFYDRHEWVEAMIAQGLDLSDSNFPGFECQEVYKDGELVAEWVGFFMLPVTENRPYGWIISE